MLIVRLITKSENDRYFKDIIISFELSLLYRLIKFVFLGGVFFFGGGGGGWIGGGSSTNRQHAPLPIFSSEPESL